MVKAKIVKLSKFGFMTNQSKDWVSCDKKFISSSAFKSLKVGDLIDNASFNDAGFLTSISVVVSKESPSVMCSVSGDTLTPRTTTEASSKVERDILKGQCLNIAFNTFFAQEGGLNPEFKESRAKAIILAQKLFNELESANYYGW